MLIHKAKYDDHNQFVYPIPEGSKLIVLVPSMARVIKDNQFADKVIIRIPKY
jgi:hypothetical protein